MKVIAIAFCLAALSFVSLVNAGGDEHGDKHYSCGCAASDLGFNISCSDSAAVTEAMAYLDAKCTTKKSCHIEGSSGGHENHNHRRRRDEHEDHMCQKSWGILSSHHDHCLAGDLLKNEEVQFHKYKDLCGEACEVTRKVDPKYSECPKVNCTEATAKKVVADLQNNNCDTACNSTACGTAYKSIKYLHDICHDVEAVEEIVGAPIHDYEDECEHEGQGCNTAASSSDPNTCDESPTTSAASPLTTLPLVLFALALVLAQ